MPNKGTTQGVVLVFKLHHRHQKQKRGSPFKPSCKNNNHSKMKPRHASTMLPCDNACCKNSAEWEITIMEKLKKKRCIILTKTMIPITNIKHQHPVPWCNDKEKTRQQKHQTTITPPHPTSSMPYQPTIPPPPQSKPIAPAPSATAPSPALNSANAIDSQSIYPCPRAESPVGRAP